MFIEGCCGKADIFCIGPHLFRNYEINWKYILRHAIMMIQIRECPCCDTSQTVSYVKQNSIFHR